MFRTLLTPVLTILVASCTLVKEDRNSCPCALTLCLEGTPGLPVTLQLQGEGYSRSLEVPRDTTLVLMVPRSGVSVQAVAGAALQEGGRVGIPPGYDCPPVYLFSRRIDCDGEHAAATVRLQKHFCLLTLSFDGPSGWGEPYWAQIRGRVGGLSADGTPLEGDFSCRLDSGGSGGVRLPRQRSGDELWLDVTMPDKMVRSFALGNLMLEAGFDWSAPDLSDMPLALNLSVTALTVRSGAWERSISLSKEI